jgi:hypothetical protein
LVSYALAGIVEVGLWTGHDWYNEDFKIGVASGVPYSNDSPTHRMIHSPKPLGGTVSDYLSKTNVQRVMSIIGDEDDWDGIFPMRNSVYTYEGFLNAVGKFPAFCNENNKSDEMTDE